jgi:hypothetical protein
MTSLSCSSVANRAAASLLIIVVAGTWTFICAVACVAKQKKRAPRRHQNFITQSSAAKTMPVHMVIVRVYSRS